jgi:hypothetical protein
VPPKGGILVAAFITPVIVGGVESAGWTKSGIENLLLQKNFD